MSLTHRLFPLLLALSVPPLQAAELQITVDGMRNDRGYVWILLYNSPGGFTSHNAHAATATIKVPAKRDSVSITMHDLPIGDYAAIALHDQNNSSDMDQKNSIPDEGYGYTRNPPGNRTPTFAQSSIFVNGKTETSIALVFHQ